MSDVTPAGQPSGQDPVAPGWLLVVAVGVAGAVLGYLLGAAGIGGDAPIGADETTSTDVSETTQTTTPPVPERDTGPRPLGTEGRRLEELVPGFRGTLAVRFDMGPERILMTWPSHLAVPRLENLPAVGRLTLNAGGTMAAALGGASEHGRRVLYMGRTRPLRPAAFDVESLAWHHTDPNRLAWLQRIGPDELELRAGRIELTGELVSQRIIVIPHHELTSPGIVFIPENSLSCYTDEGFIVSALQQTPDEPTLSWASSSLDAAGREVWSSPRGRRIFHSGCSLLIEAETSDGFEYWLVSDPTTAPRQLQWMDGASAVAAATITAGAERMALFYFDRFELWTTDGTLLLDRPFSHAVTHAVWTPGGRFVVAASWRYEDEARRTMSNALIVIDTLEGTEHEIPLSHFPHQAWAWVAPVR